MEFTSEMLSAVGSYSLTQLFFIHLATPAKHFHIVAIIPAVRLYNLGLLCGLDYLINGIAVRYVLTINDLNQVKWGRMQKEP